MRRSTKDWAEVWIIVVASIGSLRALTFAVLEEPFCADPGSDAADEAQADL